MSAASRPPRPAAVDDAGLEEIDARDTVEAARVYALVCDAPRYGTDVATLLAVERLANRGRRSEALAALMRTPLMAADS